MKSNSMPLDVVGMLLVLPQNPAGNPPKLPPVPPPPEVANAR